MGASYSVANHVHDIEDLQRCLEFIADYRQRRRKRTRNVNTVNAAEGLRTGSVISNGTKERRGAAPTRGKGDGRTMKTY